MSTDDELPQHLEQLAERGTARGAAAVWAAATAKSALRARAQTAPITGWTRFIPVFAGAAAITLLGALFVNLGRTDAPAPFPTTGGTVPTIELDPELVAESRLQGFEDCDALHEHLKAEAKARVTEHGLPFVGQGPVVLEQLLESRSSFASTGAAATTGVGDSAKAPATTTPPQLATTGGDAYSTTNVQEAGIDEPDIVKTDGKRIFALSNNQLVLAPVERDLVVARLDIINASDMILAGDRIVVFGSGQYLPSAEPVLRSRPGTAPYRYQAHEPQPRFTVTVVDASHPTALKVVSKLEIEGQYVSSRLTGGSVRLVVRSGLGRIASDLVVTHSSQPDDIAAAKERNQKLIDEAPLERWLPHYTVANEDGVTGAEQRLVDCTATFHPPEFSGLGLATVMTIDPMSPDTAKTASVVAAGETVYASAQNLYLATTVWQDPNVAFTSATPPPPVETRVHRFDITDRDTATYRASGTVRGTVLNQFSMSEHEGYLRIATTEQPQWFSGGSTPSESRVTVLADGGGALVPVGEVTGLGKTERIYAVRFIGDIGYVVTFRQVDPLYVIDLRDPTKPTVAGELKIAGYSAYLHPVGDGLLLGIGQDATEQGMRLGTQVSLFDVSDPAAPKVLHQAKLEQGNSAVEGDHHAFLWWAPRRMAVIPVQEYGSDGSSFSGAIAYDVGETTIAEKGRITRPGGMYALRSLVIGERLYTMEHGRMVVSDLTTLAEVAMFGL